MLLGGVILVSLFLVVDWFILPTVDRMNQLDLLISVKERELEKFGELHQSYQQIQFQLEEVKTKLQKTGSHAIPFVLIRFSRASSQSSH